MLMGGGVALALGFDILLVPAYIIVPLPSELEAGTAAIMAVVAQKTFELAHALRRLGVVSCSACTLREQCRAGRLTSCPCCLPRKASTQKQQIAKLCETHFAGTWRCGWAYDGCAVLSRKQ